ncbi:MAG: hypothetical protein M1831_000842 [Alyxoria varia]|nr:MAG: hypothetical protein M1831_000842 [Alyxoria varia]
MDIYFCKTCGCTMFWDNHQRRASCVSTGALSESQGLTELESQKFLADTKDGGLGVWIADADKMRSFQYNTDGDQISPGEYLKQNAVLDPKSESLKAYCLCKGVSFKILRPDERSRWRDPDDANDKKKNEPWHVVHGDRYVSEVCACESCRKASGIDASTWTFVPTTYITTDDGPVKLPFGTLKGYKSSPGVERYFCERCGATAFYAHEKHPLRVDVAAGLLEAESGARAEEWLEWQPAVCFPEDAHDRDYVQSLVPGLQEWFKKA